MDEEVGKLLYTTFFYNNTAYAIQDKVDGEVFFSTRHQRIDATKINYYIAGKKSILAYQQRFDKLNWICLDFDIVKKVLEDIKDYDFIKDDIFRPILTNEVVLCCKLLDAMKITYLIEYSGNRGIHIWIFFKTPITKSLGFTILDRIIKSVPFEYIGKPDSPIGVDMFPKVPSSKNNKVGKGVKIPLSYHLKSNSYSYLIKSFDDIERIEKIDDTFIDNQIQILKIMKRNDVSLVLKALDIRELVEYNEFEKIKVVLDERNDEFTIIESLRKSSIFVYLLDNISSLNENERRVLVGTLARIQKDGDQRFGLNLLKKIFSLTNN